MQEEDYIFVTLDNEAAVWTDAVMIDTESDGILVDAVFIDEGYGGSDFITLADDTMMLSDVDMLDLSSTDLSFEGTDITIIL